MNTSRIAVVVAIIALVLMGTFMQGKALGGWQPVDTDDESVLQAAEHAVMALNARSNSIFPFHLMEVTKAEAQVVAGVNYRLSFKTSRENTNEVTNAKAQVYVKPLTSGQNEPEYEVTHIEVVSS